MVLEEAKEGTMAFENVYGYSPRKERCRHSRPACDSCKRIWAHKNWHVALAKEIAQAVDRKPLTPKQKRVRKKIREAQARLTLGSIY
jgi:hypothetical protein